MKKLKLFLVTLLTFVLPLTVWADGTELRDINCTFSYNVTEPTYVYVYAVGDGAALIRAYGNGEEDIYNNVLLIYGISVYPGADEDGIQTIDNEQLTNDNEIYDLSGKRLQGLPAKRGIYIVNGKKVLR